MADAHVVAHDFLVLSVEAQKVGQAVVARETMMLLADVKRRAARPRTAPSVAGLGPRLQTGDYNRSIGFRITSRPGDITGSVGTNKPQGRRLELGFTAPGAHTLPHPHFGPALERSRTSFPAALKVAFEAMTR